MKRIRWIPPQRANDMECVFITWRNRGLFATQVYPSVDIPVDGSPPADSFITCSDDGTMRVWNIGDQLTDSRCLQRNLLSQDLLKIIYVDDNFDYIEGSQDIQSA